MDNYFEGIDFTKIEILLLIGVFATLLPFIIFPVTYNNTAVDDLEESYNKIDAKWLVGSITEYQKSEYNNTENTILENIKDAKEIQEIKIENATKVKQDAIIAINELVENTGYCQNCEVLSLGDFENELNIEEEKFMKVQKEALKEINELETIKVEIDLAIYKTLKSEEYQDRISIAFVIAMVTLVFSVYLSRKGYTSYTSWLEKLANDKLTFDLQLLQHVDRTKLKEFYHATFQLDSKKQKKEDKKKIEEICNKDVLEWKPIDEDVEWYSIFTEKLDYRFYEIFFSKVYADWADDHYLNKGEGGNEPNPNPGEYYPNPKFENDKNLYRNPELSPWKDNRQIKNELQANEKKLYNEIFNEIAIFNVSEDKGGSIQIKKEKTATELIKEEKEKTKIEKLLIRKIQIDLLYYSVMMNFRRGLVDATEQWMEADDALKQLEEKEIDDESKEKDLSAKQLDTSIRKIIDDFAGKMRNKIGLKKEDVDEKRKTESEKIKEAVDVERIEKIEAIKEKMINRNSWNSDDWRAMGSIYYKWREAGRPKQKLWEQFISEFKRSKTNDGEIPNGFKEDPADETIAEKFWKWWNQWYHNIDPKLEMEPDPTELNWKNHRTIRAVNSMSKSFGYKVKEDSGKAVLFFGVVFGLIIAVALTNSLDILIGALQTPIDCGPLIENNAYDCFHPDFFFVEGNVAEYQYLIILFLCFFPLGILFYHQGTILLSAKAAEQMTLGSNALIFVNFLFILVQAIVVYFLAASIGDVSAFLTFLIVLVTIDAIWVTLFTANDLRDDVRDAPVFIEWIIFDIIIALFAGIFMINYASVPPVLEEDGWMNNLPIFLTLLIVLTTRAIVDYSYGWKNFWSKFAGAE